MNETQSSHANSIESELTSSYLGESHMNKTDSTSNYMSDTSLTKPKKENLDILVINFQSVKNKRTELHNIISSCAPDIIIGTETHTNSTFNNAEILPANVPAEHIYQTFRKDRKELIEKGGGGVLIMVRPELAAEECLDLDTDCEIKWVKVAVSKSENILIG